MDLVSASGRWLEHLFVFDRENFVISVKSCDSLSPPTSSTMPTSARTTTTSMARPCRSVSVCLPFCSDQCETFPPSVWIKCQALYDGSAYIFSFTHLIQHLRWLNLVQGHISSTVVTVGCMSQLVIVQSVCAGPILWMMGGMFHVCNVCRTHFVNDGVDVYNVCRTRLARGGGPLTTSPSCSGWRCWRKRSASRSLTPLMWMNSQTLTQRSMVKKVDLDHL